MVSRKRGVSVLKRSKHKTTLFLASEVCLGRNAIFENTFIYKCDYVRLTINNVI